MSEEKTSGGREPAFREGPSDDDLVRGSTEGDLSAFEALYRRHSERTYALCLRMLGERAAAEDLMQEVWVRVWEKLPSFRGESRFSSWLHRLTANLALDELRKNGVRDRRLAVVDDPAAYAVAPSRRTEGERMDLEAAIGALPPGARTVFVLHEVEGYLHREIAEMTGTAEGTVKAQLHRARKLLREALER